MYIYGKNVAIEALNDDKEITKAIIQDNFKDTDITNELHRRNIKIIKVAKFELDKKTNNALHQGIVLEVPDYKYADLDSILKLDNPLIVILDHIEDPHNFGAIIRTCEAAGVDGIIIPEDRSVEVNGTVIKTSVGTTDKVRIVRVKNIVNTLNILKKNGFWIFGTDMDGTDYSKLNYKGKTAIICGNEGNGMSRLVRDNCDFIASIPMKGTVNSLNASVATAIIVFEAVKIRGN
jgi:23S rRNA (guanosine2251-2'-O)-methyltransferase